MSIRWQYDGGFLSAAHALRRTASRQQLANAVRVTSFEVERQVKIAMPLRTGRARGSWGHLTSTEAEPGDAVWNVSDGGLTIEQGSNVEYVPILNEGHSQQAPAGFIDAIARRALSLLVRNVYRAIGRL